MQREHDLDALRGLMLVLMALTHLPTALSLPLGQPFGFVSAAEGFVFLSAFMAGKVYTGRALRHGEDAMREAFHRRAAKIYLCQVALLVFLLSVIALTGGLARQPAITNMVSFFLEHPFTALWSGLLLFYSPPLLDILPLYILFMLASPAVLMWALHRGWRLPMALSAAVWLGAQFDLAHRLYDFAAGPLRWPVPFNQTGSFELTAWQFLWMLGLWIGASRAMVAPQPARFPRWAVGAALALASVGFLWRHALGQVAFPGHDTLNLLFDKWRLGPLRLLDFFALLVLAMHFAPWLRALPRPGFLQQWGAASLPVFCAHLVMALTALAWFGSAGPGRPWAVDAAILVGSFVVMHLVAMVSAQADREAARLKERFSARRSAPRLAASSRPVAGGQR